MTYAKLLELIEEMTDEEKQQQVVVALDSTFHQITASMVVNHVDDEEELQIKLGMMVLT